jgi:hypothetical protein
MADEVCNNGYRDGNEKTGQKAFGVEHMLQENGDGVKVEKKKDLQDSY